MKSPLPRRRLIRLAAFAATALLVAAPVASPAEAASHALIQGSGSSWAANAINQWIADVASQGEQVVFTASGAAQGRKDYANRANDFAVSDVPFQGKDPTTGQADNSQGRSFAYLPIAAGGTAFPYHIQVGSQLVRNLRLSGETLAKIFTNQITNWDDPEITRDNNGHALPSLPIIPVVHSEGAGVSAMFTRYLAKQYPKIWAPCNGGVDAETEYFPLNCGKSSGPQKAQSGSDGVMNFIKSADANGAIGTEEYSYPLLSNYPSAKMLNAAGYYTLPTQYNVAVALTKAIIDDDPSSPDYLTQNLDDVYTNPDRRTYPLSSYVYAIIPTASDDSRMTTAKRQTIADFLYYSICQGQQEIGPIGYSSLPVNLVEAGFTQIGKLKKADAGVDLTSRDVSTCHNPTFIAGQPDVNHLAVIAPEPPSCDKLGAGPCDADQGTYNGDAPSASGTGGAGSKKSGGHGATGGSAGTSGGGTPGSATTATGGGSLPSGGAAPPSAAAAGNGDLGLAAAGATARQQTASDAAQLVVPTTLAASDSDGPTVILAVLAVVLFAAVLVLPALLRRRFLRDGGDGPPA